MANYHHGREHGDVHSDILPPTKPHLLIVPFPFKLPYPPLTEAGFPHCIKKQKQNQGKRAWCATTFILASKLYMPLSPKKRSPSRSYFCQVFCY